MNKRDRIGHYIEQSTQLKGSKAEQKESYTCYIPKPLPPNPPIQLEKFYPLLEQATVSLGELNGIKTLLPNPELYLSFFGKKEAVLSSQIEGTQSSLSDFLQFDPNTKAPKVNDNREIANYISAMNYGLKEIHRLPLSRRLICEIHKKLLSHARGSEKRPGEFRTSQNWIGGTRPGNAIFVPPPPQELSACFGDFEKFLNDKKILLPSLIKVAIAHVQFEIIHPFLDGNGRLGRLLITFMLCIDKLLKDPLLYLSLYFKKHRDTYYSLLQKVQKEGDWEAWIEFFLEGVCDTSKQACQTARNIVTLFDRDAEKIRYQQKDTVGVLKTYELLKKHPVSNTKTIVQKTGVSLQTVLRSLKSLKELGLVEELKARQRNKIFTYKEYLSLLNEGTELNF